MSRRGSVVVGDGDMMLTVLMRGQPFVRASLAGHRVTALGQSLDQVGG